MCHDRTSTLKAGFHRMPIICRVSIVLLSGARGVPSVLGGRVFIKPYSRLPLSGAGRVAK